MNPAGAPQQQPEWYPPRAMILAMRGLRRRMLQNGFEAQGANNDDDEDLDEQSEEEMLREFMQTVPNDGKAKSKIRFAQLIVQRKKREETTKIIDRQKQKRREKMAPTLLIGCLSVLFNDARLSDVTLKVGPHVFHTHKLILCAWSEVFKSLTNQRWVPSSPCDELQVHTLSEHEACEECFEDFLRFMYTEKIDLTEDNVFPILMLADKYLVHDLRVVCEEYLLVTLETSTSPWMDAMKALNMTQGLNKLEHRSFSLLENNFHTWPCDDDAMPSFYSCGGSLLVKLLQSSNLVIPSETAVFKMVIRWLSTESCWVEREEFTEQMLSLIRFEHIPACDLATLLNSCSATLQPRLKEYIFEALKSRALAGEEAYFNMPKEFSDPRMYMEPLFSVRITNSKCRIDGERPFKELLLYIDDNNAEFQKFKLSCPVARQSDSQNIYLVNRSMWEIGGLAVKPDTGDKWSVRYILKPAFDDIGRSYRVAILTHKTGIEEDWELESPITCIDRGDVGKEITIDVPSTALDCDCNPEELWIQVAIYVSGRDRSSDNIRRL